MSTESPYAPFEFPPAGVEPVWWPINAGQQAALNSEAELLLMGGKSGGGKSDYLVGEGMQEHRNPALRALIVRESLGEIQQLTDRMDKVYTPLGARWRGRMGTKAWEFPSGATVRPAYLSHDKHLKRYRGNPYSLLLIDESGLHPEHRVRQMVGWLAAPVGSGLRVRGRFGSNPGGVGQSWQMHVFLRNRCPVHFPADAEDARRNETSVYPGYVYAGARWPSDDGLVHKTTAFFPSSLEDNPFYDAVKRESLLSQTAAVRAQLLEGCWCNAEGLYFDFLRLDRIAPYALLGDQWWWNHFLAIDYGYGNSSAAAGLFAAREDGAVYLTRERVERKMGSVDFARALCRDGFRANEQDPAQSAWIAPRMREQDPEPPRFSFVVIDSANDQHTGTGRSNFELMQEEFAKHGIPCLKAAKDPMGNAQNLYNGLSNGALRLTDQCPRTFRALATRVVDERRAVKKVHGDPLDDLYDMVSYGWNTWIANSVKPDRVALADDLERMRREGADDTTLARYAWQREQEARQKEQAVSRGIPLVGPRIGSPGVRR